MYSDDMTQSKILSVHLRHKGIVVNRAAQNVESRNHKTMGPIASGSSEAELGLSDKEEASEAKEAKTKMLRHGPV